MVDNRGPQLEATLIILLFTCLITVSLRCYTMGFILKRFFVEDYLAVLALLIFIAFSTLGLVAVRFGLGKHTWDVDPYDRPLASKFSFLGAVVYIALSYLVKVIVGLFLVRICSASHQKWQRISIWSMLVIVGVFYGAYFFIAIFACQPVEYVWERYDPVPAANGKCNPSVAATSISYIATVLNCVADWMLAILPATVVWKAQLDRKTKISISIILGIGSIASIATLVRVPYAKELVNQDDYLYNFVPLATWSTIEAGTALTASSLATLKPLFRKFGAIFTTTNESHSWTMKSRTSRRQSAPAAKASHGQRVRSYSSPYVHQYHPSRKGSLASGGSEAAPSPTTISYPMPVRWHYINYSDDVELNVCSPISSRDILYPPPPPPPPSANRPVYPKTWEDDVS